MTQQLRIHIWVLGLGSCNKKSITTKKPGLLESPWAIESPRCQQNSASRNRGQHPCCWRKCPWSSGSVLWGGDSKQIQWGCWWESTLSWHQQQSEMEHQGLGHRDQPCPVCGWGRGPDSDGISHQHNCSFIIGSNANHHYYGPGQREKWGRAETGMS